MQHRERQINSGTSINELHQRLVEFRDRRDWKRFHTPKDLALSISIESAELLELFQWKSDKEIDKTRDGDEFIKAATAFSNSRRSPGAWADWKTSSCTR